MIIHNVIQGTEAWHELRAKHGTASEASAMLGLSKYQSRNDLLKQKATGVTPDVTPAMQALFDKGHAAEAKARPIAEAIMGSELFPCTATDDGAQYLASFDGIDMMEAEVWEHKMNNQALMTAIRDNAIPDTHWPQLEQQLLVSGAEKALFMCSDGTAENMAHTWYESIPERRQQVIDGWAQFDKDLASYEHKEAVVAPAGKAPDALPSLHIEVKGMVTASNLGEFKANAMSVIGGIKTDLQTDGDFADADKTAKWLKGVEEKLESAKEQALSQTADIDALFKTIDAIKEEARAKRLDLGKQVKAQKENIKSEICLNAASAYDDHIRSVNKGLSYDLPPIAADFSGSIKGKRTIESLHNAVDTELARVKIEASRLADKMRSNSALLESLSGEHRFLFADVHQLILKEEDDLKAAITSRIAGHKEQEARQKAEAEAREAQRIEREAQQEARRIEQEQKQPKPVEQPVLKPEIAETIQKSEPEQVRQAIPVGQDVDIVLRKTVGFDYLPLIICDGIEVYCGSYQKTAALALDDAQRFLSLQKVA